MDSIHIQYGENVINSEGFLFTIVQKSIRFEVCKELVIYEDSNNYLGNFRIVQKSSFKIKDLSPMVSMLIFSAQKQHGIEELLKFKIKGKISEETEMCLICAEPVGFDKKFIIPSRTEKNTVANPKDIVAHFERSSAKKAYMLKKLISRFNLKVS